MIELGYEDLVAEPFETIRSIYERLGLGDFESAEANLNKRLANHKNYRTNSHPIDAETEKLILDRWRGYAERYGYVSPANPPA